MFFITEIFCHGKPCFRYTHTGTRGLIHLPEHQSCLFQNPGFFHFCPEVISLTGTFSNTGEDGISAVLGSNIADKFLNQHRLTYTGTAEKTDFTTFCIWRQKVDNLNTGFQNLYYRTLFFKRRRVSVNNPVLYIMQLFAFVYGFTQNIKKTTQSFFSYRYGNTCSCSSNLHILAKSVTRSQHNTAHRMISGMLCHFHNKLSAV